MTDSRNELADLSASDAARMIRRGDITSRDLVAACVARIAAREPEVQAWEYFDADYALSQAEAADAHLASGKAPGLLQGLPVAVKDIIATADMPTQNGTPIYRGRQPEADATCVGCVTPGRSSWVNR